MTVQSPHGLMSLHWTTQSSPDPTRAPAGRTNAPHYPRAVPNTLKAAAAERLPALQEVLDVFDQNIQDFLDQGIPTESIKPGDILDPFMLDDANGNPVSLDKIVESGPAVIDALLGRLVPPIAILPCAPTSRNITLQLGAFDALPRLCRHPAHRRQTNRSRRKRRPALSSRSSPTQAVVWLIGSASHSTRPTTSSLRSASSVSIWRRSQRRRSRPLARPTVLVVDHQDSVVRFVDVQARLHSPHRSG